MQDLNDSMQSHLRLHFNNEEASDEQVKKPTHSQLQEIQCGPRLDWHAVWSIGDFRIRPSTEQIYRNLISEAKQQALLRDVALQQQHILQGGCCCRFW